MPTYHDSGGERPSFRSSQKALPLKEKSFDWPSLPGTPRKVFKPHGKRIKTAVKENY